MPKFDWNAMQAAIPDEALADDPQAAITARAQAPLIQGLTDQVKEDYANRLTYQQAVAAAKGDPEMRRKVAENSLGFAMGALDAPAKAVKGVAKRAAKALDMSEAARMARAKRLGFDPEATYYHGTKADIEGFDPEALGASTNAPSARKGFFFAEDASTASDYADLSKGRASLRAKAGETKAWSPVEDLSEALRKKYGEKFKTPDEYTQYSLKYTPEELDSIGIKKVDPNDPLLEKYISARKKAEQETEVLFADPKSKLDNAQYERKHLGDEPIGWTKTHLADQKKNLAYWENYLAAFQKPLSELSPGEQASRKFGKSPEAVQEIIERTKDKIRNWSSLKAKAEAEHAAQVQSVEEEIGRYKKMLTEETSGQNVLPVHLKMENPYIHDYQGVGYREESYNDILQKAKEAGHDSVILKNTFDPADRENRVMQDIRVVFDPSQIRSKFAAFDPKKKKSGNISAAIGAATLGAGAMAAGSGEAQASETIRMQGPDGKIRKIPISLKGEAIAAGGKVVR